MPDTRLQHARPAVGVPAPLRPVVFWVSRDEISGAQRYPPHRHAHHELILPERGTYRCRVAGGELRVRPGEAALVCPGDIHEDPLGGPVAYLACGFRIEPGGDAHGSPSLLAAGSPPAQRHLRAGDALGALAAWVRAAAGSPPDAYGWAALDAACAAWLWTTARTLPPESLAPPFRLHAAGLDQAAALRAAFAAHLGGAASLAVLAESAGMSPRTFAAACRQHLGLAPLAAFRRARCEAAAALLAGGAGVAETAAQLGFANPFHFSRLFHRAMGAPPSTWLR